MQEDSRGGPMEVFVEDEIRHMGVMLMNAPTARDMQQVVGASDLSNQCDHCVALALRGIKRESQISEKTFMGREIGTAIHSHLEQSGLANPELLVGGEGSVEFERKVVVGEIAGYGIVPGHIDWTLFWQLVDVKGSTRKKSALLEDYLQSVGFHRVGLKPRWERQARGNYKLDLGAGMIVDTNITSPSRLDGFLYKFCELMKSSSHFIFQSTLIIESSPLDEQ